MSTFLYLTPSRDCVTGRRVNFANIGSLFAEVEEPAVLPASTAPRRWKVVLLIAALLLGDMVLIARPQMSAGIAAVPSALKART